MTYGIIESSMARYELIERIGVGGMAEIFRGQAFSGSGFVKPVAIKRILPHLSEDSRFVERLIAEANTLSKLRHRNIVQVYDVGLGDDDQHFLVMEYVDGTDLETLYSYLEKRRVRFPLDLALHIGAEVCDALEHAHTARNGDAGLVHRDVSPSNILLSKSGEIKLSDFAIAKSPDEETGHDGIRGKFAYIAPEQAQGKRVDGRSDVFSLGIVMYEFMTGCRLFSKLPDMEALAAVRAGTMPLPRTQDPELPREIENLLVRALAPLSGDRFPTAAAFGAKMRELRYSLDEGVKEPMAQIRSWVNRCEGASLPEPHGSGFFAEEKTVVKMMTAPGFEKEEWDADESQTGLTAVVEKGYGLFTEEDKTQIRSIDVADGPKPGDADYLEKLEELALGEGLRAVPAKPVSALGEMSGDLAYRKTESADAAAVPDPTKEETTNRVAGHSVAPRGDKPISLEKNVALWEDSNASALQPVPPVNQSSGWERIATGAATPPHVANPRGNKHQGSGTKTSEGRKWLFAILFLIAVVLVVAIAAKSCGQDAAFPVEPTAPFAATPVENVVEPPPNPKTGDEGVTGFQDRVNGDATTETNPLNAVTKGDGEQPEAKKRSSRSKRSKRRRNRARKKRRSRRRNRSKKKDSR